MPFVVLFLSLIEDDSVAPRRRLLFESGTWLVILASRSAVRERVPWPNPRLAMFDTCRRMSSMEVVRLVSSGLGRPNTSHLIFGFLVARARFFLVLSARHPVDSFIGAPLYSEPGISNMDTYSKEMRGPDSNAKTTLSIILPGVHSAENDGTYKQHLRQDRSRSDNHMKSRGRARDSPYSCGDKGYHGL